MTTNAPDWTSLSKLDDGELQSRLLDHVNEIMKGLNDEDEDEAIAGLAPPLRVMWLTNWLDFEVTTGSLLAYFSNSHGRHVALTAEALREIGASGMAAVLERAARSVERNSDAWAASEAKLASTQLYDVVRPYEDLPNVDEMLQLTDEYWQEAERDVWWGQRLSDYLRRSVEELAAAGEQHAS
jgi:hypothetical protein